MRFAVAGVTLLGVAIASGQPSSDCKTFPGDRAWPSSSEWSSFNRTVGGRLVATVPLGTPCHGVTFDNAACASLKDQWQFEKIQ